MVENTPSKTGGSVLGIKHCEFFPLTPSCVFSFFYSTLESAIVESADINHQAASLVSAIVSFSLMLPSCLSSSPKCCIISGILKATRVAEVLLWFCFSFCCDSEEIVGCGGFLRNKQNPP